MHKKIVDISLRYRFLVLIVTIAIAVLGIYCYSELPVDAFPDISPIMVPVFVEAEGMAPEEIERLITFPIESTMNGLPGVTQIKSTSAFGMAVIYVYFKDDINIYFARQVVSERLSDAMASLPQMEEPPKLGPISTGLGQIFIYYLTIEKGTNTEGKEPNTYLREINDWIVKYQLQTVPGVTDILSIGGHVLQYQIRINPNALNKYKVTLEEVVDAVQENNRNAGGQFLVLTSEEYLVRGIGLLQNLDHIRNIHIKVLDGIPVMIKDIAEVAYGEEIRRGVVSRNGEQEVVSGIVLKLFGENTSDVIERLYKKIPEVQASLPDGIHLLPYYEQAELVQNATWTVKKALLLGAFLVIITLTLFLGNIRSAFIVALALPLSAFISIICMKYAGISANLMSLGGIAIGIGMLGDGAIVMVENIFRHLNEEGSKSERSNTDIILVAAKEVSRPIIFSIAIIIIVFLPIFTLKGVEGKMFSPMAFTISFALLGSMLYAIISAPVLSTYLLKGGEHREFILIKRIKELYRPLLIWAMNRRRAVVIIATFAFLISMALLPFLGTEFIPTLEEGSIMIGVTMAPSISLQKATETIMKMERKIIEFSEVEEVISRIGRPEAGSHPHPVNYAEIHIELMPMSSWKSHSKKEELIEDLNHELSLYSGVQLNFTQPIQNAFDELLTGVKAQLAIMIFGEDLTVLRRKAQEIHDAIDVVPGLVDLSVEQSFGQPQVQVIADRAACSRYGVNVNRVLELVELAIGGRNVDYIFLNIRRFGIHIRYQEQYRSDPETIRHLLIQTQNGTLIPLEQVAEVKLVTGPIQINRENNHRRWVIQGNIRGRDMGSVVADIKSIIDERITLPPGYYIEYGGQFENQQRAMARLAIIVPVVIALVFFMLGLTFGSIHHALLIIINIPLALIGGIIGLFIMGEYLSVPAAVGFIALFGIAVQNGVVLLSYINELYLKGKSLQDSVIEGALLRLRPVLMTALTTIFGLFPLLLSQGIGAEVQRPLAIVVVFGLSTSTLLTLFVIPALYGWFEGKRKIVS
ncbi:MAG: efflux RND transporter permease subunit [Deltaproteobacteria bacterium]|nr:efflux RND transporter permease subunit [Deltaproteobacteria bacterium]